MEKREPAVEASDFRSALRQWASGVSVVACSYDGHRHGMTVSSFISVSLEPPWLLVSIQKGKRTLQMIQQAKCFGVTILSSDQREVSDLFAGRLYDRPDRFENLEDFTLATGAPFIAHGLAFFDCRLSSFVEAGDHTLVIGQVVAVKTNPGKTPLVYYDRAYRELTEEESQQEI